MPRHIGSTDGEFSVVQFFVSNEHEYVRAWVSIEEAIEAFQHYTTSVGVKLGFVTKVVLTDGGDCTCAVWTPKGGLELFNQPEETGSSEDEDYQLTPREEERAFAIQNGDDRK